MRTSLVIASLALAGAAMAAQPVPAEGRTALMVKHPDRLAPQPKILDAPSLATPKGPDAARIDYDYELGEEVVVGTSRYDYQHNGSYGKMVAISSDGVAHGAFMGGINITTGRRVVAWCVDSGLGLTPAADVSADRTGYCTVASTSAAPSNTLAGDSGVVGFHSAAGSWFGSDFGGCTMAFNLVQETESSDILWPHIALDYQDKVHSVMGDFNTDDVLYNASTDGATWDGNYVIVTNVSNTLSQTMAAAKHAPGAAIIYGPDAPATPPIFYDGSYGAGQWHHDVMVYEARDEDNDLFAQIAEGEPINITKYCDPTSTAPFRWGVFGYADMDGMYDSQETPDLHVVFPTPVSMVDSLLYIDLLDSTYYVTDFSHVDYHSSIWHYNVTAGEWGHVGGWLTGDSEADDLPYPFSGVFRIKEDRPQLAHDPDTGYLYCLWNVYDKNDLRAPGADNKAMANGELFMACSADNGLTWGPRVNITNTQTPECVSPDCLSETFGSLAEIVDNGYLHISFMLDEHAGASIRNTDANDGSVETENDYYYMRIPVASIPPHDGTPWNADGHIGLSHYNSHRGLVWTDGALDSVIYKDRVMVFNEGQQARWLNRLTFFHDVLDVFGTDELNVGWEVKPGDPLEAGDFIMDPFNQDDWNGYLPAQAMVQVHLNVGHIGYPLREHAFRFEFSDGTVRDYRFEYYGPGGDGSLVELIDMDNLGQYASQVLYERTNALPAPTAPVDFALAQNVPNPFNPATEISFTLDGAGQVSLKVYNLQGAEVARLVDGPMGAGTHTVAFDGSQFSSGVYFYTLEAAGRSETRKMLLTK